MLVKKWCTTQDPGYRTVPHGLDCILEPIYPTMLTELGDTKGTLKHFLFKHFICLSSLIHSTRLFDDFDDPWHGLLIRKHDVMLLSGLVKHSRNGIDHTDIYLDDRDHHLVIDWQRTELYRTFMKWLEVTWGVSGILLLEYEIPGTYTGHRGWKFEDKTSKRSNVAYVFTNGHVTW